MEPFKSATTSSVLKHPKYYIQPPNRQNNNNKKTNEQKQHTQHTHIKKYVVGWRWVIFAVVRRASLWCEVCWWPQKAVEAWRAGRPLTVILLQAWLKIVDYCLSIQVCRESGHTFAVLVHHPNHRYLEREQVFRSPIPTITTSSNYALRLTFFFLSSISCTKHLYHMRYGTPER